MRHIMDEPAAGSGATLRPGDGLEVRLRQPADAGYLWSVKAVPGLVEPRGDRTDAGTLPGAAAVRAFRFEAAGPGTGTLRLALARPWEDTAVEVRELSISVIRA